MDCRLHRRQGERHIETFDRKKDADARHAEVTVDVRKGVHVAPSKSITLREAGEKWIEAAEHELERTTVDSIPPAPKVSPGAVYRRAEADRHHHGHRAQS